MPRQHTVAAVIADGVSPFELSVACEVFGLPVRIVIDRFHVMKNFQQQLERAAHRVVILDDEDAGAVGRRVGGAGHLPVHG